ncbi:hypothetical protein UC34_06875 [Pandoraea vervacti]|uniref:Alpha/beta hydrolase fold-3 domain-containing protein n=1 Tax=Pandoraea vervacti TaxID=656178 RepID=A0ABN4FMZ5_9BURK|nr:alpha/beta hydrolase [Pandoraea vervacti]AJP56786.1 hypothetical protein UC34_06875 [Pandoraea vervacti]
MPLNPQAAKMLEILAMMPPIDYSADGAKARAVMAAAAAAGPSPFGPGDEVAHIEDRTITGPGGPLALRLYYPRANASNLPVTVYFHGGGFVLGCPKEHDNICRSLAKRADTLVVSVDYRLAPEAKFPAPIDDGWAALCWVRDTAKTLGADASRIAVAGDSAGGNIAAVVAHRARDNGFTLCHQSLIYPVTDSAMNTASYSEMGTGHFLTTEMMRWYWEQYLPHKSAGSDPMASPLRQKRLQHLPPATIVTAQYDPLRDEGEAYGLALIEAGVPVRMQRWPGQIHGFASMMGMIDAADEALTFVASALRESFDTTSQRAA